MIRVLGHPALWVVCAALVAGYAIPLGMWDENPFLIGMAMMAVLPGSILVSLVWAGREAFARKRWGSALIALALSPACMVGWFQGVRASENRLLEECRRAVLSLEPLVRSIEEFARRNGREPARLADLGGTVPPPGFEKLEIIWSPTKLRYPLAYGHLDLDALNPSDEFDKAWIWERLEFEARLWCPRSGGEVQTRPSPERGWPKEPRPYLLKSVRPGTTLVAMIESRGRTYEAQEGAYVPADSPRFHVRKLTADSVTLLDAYSGEVVTKKLGEP